MPVRNNDRTAIDRARRLRRAMSVSEQILWSRLKSDALGVRFRRQYPAGPYVLDFFCPAARLCVEVDGPHHDDRLDLDHARDAWVASEGIVTLRFKSGEVYSGDLDSVIARIREASLARVKVKPTKKNTAAAPPEIEVNRPDGQPS